MTGSSVAARETPGWVPGDRILYEHGGEFVDEIVCHNVTIHMEVMSDDCVWMGVDGGNGRRLMVNIFRDGKRGPVVYRVEDDGDVTWGWDREDEHPDPAGSDGSGAIS